MLPAGSTLFKKNKRRRDSLPSPRKAFKNQTPEEPTENPTRKPKPSQSYQTPTTQNNQAKGAAILGWCEGHSEVYSVRVWDASRLWVLLWWRWADLLQGRDLAVLSGEQTGASGWTQVLHLERKSPLQLIRSSSILHLILDH